MFSPISVDVIIGGMYYVVFHKGQCPLLFVLFDILLQKGCEWFQAGFQFQIRDLTSCVTTSNHQGTSCEHFIVVTVSLLCIGLN